MIIFVMQQKIHTCEPIISEGFLVCPACGECLGRHITNHREYISSPDIEKRQDEFLSSDRVFIPHEAGNSRNIALFQRLQKFKLVSKKDQKKNDLLRRIDLHFSFLKLPSSTLQKISYLIDKSYELFYHKKSEPRLAALILLASRMDKISLTFTEVLRANLLESREVYKAMREFTIHFKNQNLIIPQLNIKDFVAPLIEKIFCEYDEIKRCRLLIRSLKILEKIPDHVKNSKTPLSLIKGIIYFAGTQIKFSKLDSTFMEYGEICKATLEQNTRKAERYYRKHLILSQNAGYSLKMNTTYKIWRLSHCD